MFKIIPNPTFLANVHLSVPGSEQLQVIKITFKHKNKTALNAWLTKDDSRSDAETLSEVIEGWADVFDSAGEAVAYSVAELDRLLENYPVAHREILRAYLTELTQAKQKN